MANIDLKLLKQIDWKQPKLAIPAIIFVPTLGVLWLVCDMFNTQLPEDNGGMETTEYINTKVQDARYKGDGIGNKYDNMLSSYGKVQDHTAVESIEQDTTKLEQYESKYSDAEIAALDDNSAEAKRAMANLEKLQKQLDEKKAAADASGSFDKNGQRTTGNSDAERQVAAQLQEYLAKSKAQAEGLSGAGGNATPPPSSTAQVQVQGMADTPISAEAAKRAKERATLDMTANIDRQEDAVRQITEKTAYQEAAVAETKNIDRHYFNTIAVEDKSQRLISAIIDEEIKAKEGSRVRLRLLTDMVVGKSPTQTFIPKGTYLYATMSGFGSQRVQGQVESVLINGELTKLSLSIYDTDGLEGLYVPESSFRDLTKEVGADALTSSNPSSMFTNSGLATGSLISMGYQAASNAVTKISNSISKALKKNKARLKYGTVVYLINSADKKEQNRKEEEKNSAAGASKTISDAVKSSFQQARQGISK